jgi:flavin-dependent dehydrogenase
VPESDRIIRVGVMKRKNVLEPFKEFVKQFKGKVLEIQGGLIPVYDPTQKTEKTHTFLVGDAATQVKPSTGGGIIPGIKAGNILADTLTTNKSYEQEWKKTLGRELWLHLKIRQALDKFTHNDWNNLIKDCREQNMRNILETIDRDQVRTMIKKIIITKPAMLKYAIKAFI